MRRLAALIPLVLAGCATAPGAATSAAPSSAPKPAPTSSPAASSLASSAVTADELRRDLYIFAADSFGGRDAVLPSGVMAAKFLATRAAAIGLEPAGDSGFYQRVPMSWEMFAPNTRFSVTPPTGAVTELKLGADILPLLTLGPGALTKLAADGDLVFGGYGLNDKGVSDNFGGQDLAGKVLVFVNSAPIADSAKRAAFETIDAAGPRIGFAFQSRVAAVIVVGAGKFGAQYTEMAGSLSGGNVTLQGSAGSTDAPRQFPMVFFVKNLPGSPFLPKVAGDMKPQALGKKFSARVELATRKVTGYNVVGVVRGRDPSMNKTYVAYGAHLDHIGIQTPVSGDSIANGADDDGSGSVTLLALARAYQQMPEKPRRSVLFVWHTGEEKGLLGSSWFTDHPTVPLDSIVAQLNADMIGRNQPDSLYLIGPIAAPKGQSKVLGAIVDSVNLASASPFKINREWDSPTHPEHFYDRSDHFNYAKHGVPIVFFTTGDHPDYHKVSDEPAKIDFAKMAHVGNLMMQTGIAVANRPTRPKPALVP
ncbi:MAG: M28 family peptidase [Gemmatimonadota bacterium]|nr:M28 family peptidase [Gemmatimonadota bacterium]